MRLVPTATLMLALVGLSGCPRQTSSPQPAAPPPGPRDRSHDKTPAKAPVVEPTPVVEEPCAPDGRPWDGKPVDCSYEHDGCCYDSAASACEAAGCPAEQCVVLESYPAQITC